jgi:hypothetical protein
MTTSKGPPGAPPGQPGPRGRRRPATIDLTATEIASAPEAPAPPEAGPPPSTAPVATPAAPPEPAHEPPSYAAAEASRPEPRPAEEASPEREPRSRPAGPAIAWLPPDFPWPLAAAGAAGAALTLILLTMVGVFTSGDGGAPPLEPRIERMEQRMRELVARPLPVPFDQRAVDDLASRLARLETVVATPKPPATDPALANRIATLEGEIRALAERVGVLGRRNDEIASIAGEARTRSDTTAAAVVELQKAAKPAAPVVQRADLDALASRIAALEQTAKRLQAELGERAGGPGGDRSLRLLVVANALQAAVERGAPYVAELNAAKAAAANPAALAPLEPFAKAGVPGADALARELLALVPALSKAVGATSRDGGFIDRLKANAEKIVRVRPVDEAPGDDASAVVQRIEARASQGNLAGALAEVAKLPPPARAVAKDWTARAEARNAAIEASRRFATDALAAAGKPL